MAIGLVGQKRGMTRIFTEKGTSVPVTLVEVSPNRITQIKSESADGYRAIQVTTGQRRASRITKPLAGHFAKAAVEPGRGLWEFRLLGEEGQELAIGNELTVELFTEGQQVDVQGKTRGKGFAGTVKRHNFAMQRATHGNSLSHRVPGSIGQNQTPGRVFKGKKMSGQMGNKNRTAQNLKIVKIDKERNLLFVSGAVPGAPGGNVIVKPAIKSSAKGA